MDIFFQDPDEVPLPPEEVRVREFRVEPWMDGRRVRIILEVDPFQKRPNAGVSIVDTAGNEVAQASIIETIARKMEINLHLRQDEPAGEYTARVKLYYEPTPDMDDPLSLENQAGMLVVDQREAKFMVVRT